MPRWIRGLGVVLVALSSACGSADDEGVAGASGADAGGDSSSGSGGWAGGGGSGGSGGSAGTGGAAGFAGTGGSAGSAGTGATGGTGGTGATGGTGGSGGAPACAHDPCEEGVALAKTCSDCVESICSFDVYCCAGTWDEQCVSEAVSVCGLDCPPPPCTAETCPDGCCTSGGYCQKNPCQLYAVDCGTYFDPSGGVAGCDQCEPDGTCYTCDTVSCTACVPDCAGKACGDPDGCGSRCDGPCSSGFCSLALGQCTAACNDLSCPFGCCRAGKCEKGTTDDACGSYGMGCATCNASSGACLSIPGSYQSPSPGGHCAQCDSTTCPHGCCDGSGHCITVSDDTACGHAGADCADCTTQGSFCAYGGTCADCKPQCAGKACGDADGCGGTCLLPCSAGKTCVVGSTSMASGCYPCGASTCPNGCCSAQGACVGGYARDACGDGGESCDDCGAQACVTNTHTYPYQRACGPCGSGCQPAYPGEYHCQADGCGGICPDPNCDGGMGFGGTCQIDNTGYAQCMPSDYCDPFSCGGCCSYQGWFEATCEPGILPTKCGMGGQGCVDCVALGTTCDAAAQRCANCTPQCDAANSCGRPDGCGGLCTGALGKCTDGATCTNDGVCDCGAGKSLCYDTSYQYVCWNTDSDPGHCGSCSAICPAGVACVNGACQCPTGSHYCAGAQGAPGVCTNIANDSAHCGSCTETCPGTPCNHGVCGQCPTGTTACPYSDPPTCADLTSDVSNCGQCGNECPNGYPCSGGFCQCGGGLVACNGTCVDVQTSGQHCGTCFNSCPTGVPCQNGTCVCPGGTTLCYGTCTNLDVDPDNCGQCGNTCYYGESCVSGTCM